MSNASPSIHLNIVDLHRTVVEIEIFIQYSLFGLRYIHVRQKKYKNSHSQPIHYGDRISFYRLCYVLSSKCGCYGEKVQSVKFSFYTNMNDHKSSSTKVTPIHMQLCRRIALQILFIKFYSA